MYTSRERLLTALDHREPDRVPIDLGGNQTGIHKLAYRKLLQHLSQEEEVVIMDIIQQLAKPSEAMLERLHVDTRYIWAQGAKSFSGKVVQRERNGRTWNDFTDEFGVTWSMPEDSPTTSTSPIPLWRASRWSKSGSIPFRKGTIRAVSRGFATEPLN